MSTNPDINRAQGFVTSEPTGDGIKLYANDVDITDEIGGSGGGGDGDAGPLIVYIQQQMDSFVFNKTAGEIKAAASRGILACVEEGLFNIPVLCVAYPGVEGGQFFVFHSVEEGSTGFLVEAVQYTTEFDDGYPSHGGK